MDFSVGGLGGLSAFEDSPPAGTLFTEETDSMSQGIPYKRLTHYQVIGKENYSR
jgi:hypothetical protein